MTAVATTPERPLRQAMPTQARGYTEAEAAGELGIDRLELYLVACAEKAGHYDALTHLLVFRDDEVDALARRLGATRRHAELGETQRRAIPEPTAE